jgi:hypothetical protein
MSATWFDKDMSDIVSLLLLPYNYVQDANTKAWNKSYCTFANWNFVKDGPNDVEAKSAALIKAD